MNDNIPCASLLYKKCDDDLHLNSSLDMSGVFIGREADMLDLLKAEGCVLHVETLSAMPHRYGWIPVPFKLRPHNLWFQTAK